VVITLSITYPNGGQVRLFGAGAGVEVLAVLQNPIGRYPPDAALYLGLENPGSAVRGVLPDPSQSAPIGVRIGETVAVGVRRNCGNV
jgi:hypothetical protein